MFKRKCDEKNRKRGNYNKLQKHVKPYESSDDDDDDSYKNKQKAITYLKSLQEKYPTASFDFIIDKIDFKIDNLSKNKHNKQFVSVLHDVISEIYMEMENETKSDNNLNETLLSSMYHEISNIKNFLSDFEKKICNNKILIKMIRDNTLHF